MANLNPTNRFDLVPICGAPGSPYTRKMLAVLRYRRIPYRLLLPQDAARQGLPAAKVPLLPTLWFADENGQAVVQTDSSPLIRRFEATHAGRAVVPPDAALAFVDRLLEDYADEWLTKPMFHYRWAFDADSQRAASVLPHWRGLSRPDAELDEAGRVFAARQIGRLRFVGSSPETAALIEASYDRFLVAFNAHLREHPFLMGQRPGASDFATFGQLTQLAQFDPTPMALTLARAPRVFAWVSLLEDLSGQEPADGDWLDANAVPPTLRALLTEAGRVYVPVMLANALALANGAAEVRAAVDGATWVQQPFAYQGKCVQWLRQAYAALDEPARMRVDAALAGTGCEALVGSHGQGSVRAPRN